ncbi:hypothetical protein I4F81_010309 [Pyropia yezoensis]|uniref:Uncharacterized protein n=1 Tax=Pyropia yezoensis TaxID=2788 RepID=A0ACC3CC45_PYRYE|nr:hypothetical protein I4F81_010309 [Neopyropia yezoensis]
MMRQAGARLVGPPGPPDEDDPTATAAERVAAALGRRRQREEEELLRLALHAAPRHRAPILRLGLAAQVELEVAGCSLWSTDARDALWGVLTRRGQGESLVAVRQTLWETEGPAVAAAVELVVGVEREAAETAAVAAARSRCDAAVAAARAVAATPGADAAAVAAAEAAILDAAQAVMDAKAAAVGVRAAGSLWLVGLHPAMTDVLPRPLCRELVIVYATRGGVEG